MAVFIGVFVHFCPWLSSTYSDQEVTPPCAQSPKRTFVYSASTAFTIDPAGFISPSLPNDLVAANYNGVVGRILFATAQVSRKTFDVQNVGGTSTDIVDSPFLTLTQAFAHFNASYFDVADPEARHNYQVAGSLSYLVATATSGWHDIKGGMEHFVSTFRGGNSQSATGFVFHNDYLADAGGAPILDTNDRFQLTFLPGSSFLEDYSAVRGATIDVATTSLYLQDH